jgi:hypothetical protein
MSFILKVFKCDPKTDPYTEVRDKVQTQAQVS